MISPEDKFHLHVQCVYNGEFQHGVWSKDRLQVSWMYNQMRGVMALTKNVRNTLLPSASDFDKKQRDPRIDRL